MGFRKQGYFLTISVISVSSSSSCDFKGAISLSVMLYMKKKTAFNASSAKNKFGLNHNREEAWTNDQSGHIDHFDGVVSRKYQVQLLPL